MASIPIAMRSRNRPVYLDTTLKSLWATDIPSDAPMIVVDDCSDDELQLKYLNTCDDFVLPQPQIWRRDAKFVNAAATFAPVHRLKGIADKVEVVHPEMRMGVFHGVFWCVQYMMERFPEAEAIILIEADAVFHKDWYTTLMNVFPEVQHAKGPNGDTLGLLTCYDRIGSGQGDDPPWTWRKVKKLANGHWGCSRAIGGVVYLVHREFYKRAIDVFRQLALGGRPGKVSGDTAIQGLAGDRNCNLAATRPSFCQHIGVESLAWPSKGYRYCRNCKKPIAFEDEGPDGYFSKDWQ